VSYLLATTPFGGPVVPEVYIIPTLPPGSASSTSGSRSGADMSRSKSQSAPSPAGPPKTTVCLSPGRSPATAASAPRRSSWKITAAAPESRRMCCSVGPRCEMFTGTDEAPMNTIPRWAQRNSGRLPIKMATRSPGRTPMQPG